MPLQTFNFMQPVMQHDLSNLGNIFGNYYKGYEQARTPHKLAQQELAQNLFNEIQKVELQYKPQKYQADIGHTNAQTGLTNQQAKYYPQKIQSEIDLSKAKAAHQNNPLSRLTGDAAHAASRHAFLSDARVPQETKDMALKQWDLADRMQEARLAQVNGVNSTRNLNLLPSNERNALYGQYKALGIPQTQVADLFSQGISPEAIALWRVQNNNHEGVPSSNEGNNMQQQVPPALQQEMPEQQPGPTQNLQQSTQQAPQVIPEFAPTQANITNINETKGNTAEADYLHEVVTDYGKRYAKQYNGYSPQYYADAVLGKHPQKRAEFIAGQIMGPDTALLNIKLAGGSTAHEAIKDVMGRMAFNAKIQGWTKDPETYEKAMKLVNKHLTHAAKIRTDVMSGKKTEKKSSEDDPMDIL